MERFDGKEHKKILAKRLAEAFGAEPETPILELVVVGDDPVTQRFVRAKCEFAERVGVDVRVHAFSIEATTQDLVDAVRGLNHTVPFGVVVQLPLPAHVSTHVVLNTVPARADVDVLSRTAWEEFCSEVSLVVPPVAAAAWYALATHRQPTSTDAIAVVGQGELVGKPICTLLENHKLAYRVVDKDTPQDERVEILGQADIIVTGVGIPGLIKPEDIKPGVTLVDAGTSESAGVLAGDIDPLCYEKAEWYTPVPGGIGPLTVAMIFVNLYNSWYGNLELSPNREA